MAKGEQLGAVWGAAPGPAETMRPRRVSRKVWRILGGTLATSIALGLAGGVARKGDDAEPDTGGQAGGLAPAIAPSNRPTSPLVAESPHAGVVAPPTEKALPSQEYNGKADCVGLEVTRPNATTLHITPKISKTGNPNPGRYVTVAESLTGDNPSKFSDQQVYFRVGLGGSVNVRVPEDMSIVNTSVPVSIAYYPPGTEIPTEADAFSVSAENVQGLFLGCGNAAMQWLMENGGIQLPSGERLPGQ